MDDELITNLSKLTIHQRRLISEVVVELLQQDEQQESTTAQVTNDSRGSTLGPNLGSRRLPRAPNHQFVDTNSVPLSIGDRVEILNSRRTGKTGDIGEVTRFNRTFVAFRVARTGSIGQRASFNLRFLE